MILLRRQSIDLYQQAINSYKPAPVPLKRDITKPNNPTTLKAMMASIGGNPVPFPTISGSNVACTTGGAAVKVGKRVATTELRLNCAARVGSTVGVTRGVGVGGGSTMGKRLCPDSNTTNAEYTQATFPGTPA
jgi:hypothetical protein